MSLHSYPSSRYLLVPLLVALIATIGLSASTWSKQKLEQKLRPLINDSSLPPGTDQCSRCHRELSERYLETGHARTLWRGDDPKVIARFANLEYRWKNDGPTYRYLADDDGLWLTQDGSDLRLRVDWVMGSGGHSQGAIQLTTNPDGVTEVLEHILAWYPSVGLAPSLGNDEKKIIPNHLSALGVWLEHANARDCLGCHSTHAVIDTAGMVHSNEVVGRVGCVRCHPEADKHVAADGAINVFTERWSQLPPQSVLERCGECHKRFYEIDPRDLNTEQRNIVRFAPVGLSQSRCFKGQRTGTPGHPEVRLDCLSCHDMHRPLPKDMGVYRQVCNSCHYGEKAISGPCPSQPETSNCVSCHMPVLQTDPNLRFTDHWIRVHKP